MLSYLIVLAPCEVSLPIPQIRRPSFREVKWFSALPSWWDGAGLELRFIKAWSLYQYLGAFCFHISGKPLWESRLHQLCLGQPSKMGWVHALVSVLENLTDGGWLGSRGDGRQRRQSEMQPDTPSQVGKASDAKPCKWEWGSQSRG